MAQYKNKTRLYEQRSKAIRVSLTYAKCAEMFREEDDKASSSVADRSTRSALRVPQTPKPFLVKTERDAWSTMRCVHHNMDRLSCQKEK